MKSDYSHLRPSLRKKIEHSIEIIKKAEQLSLTYDPENGFFLAFSGGKDSQCLYHVAQLAGVKFKAHFSPTSVDPPEVIRFIRRSYPDVEIAKIKQSIYKTAIKKHIMPTQIIRWCCQIYKESAGAGKVTLIGIRHAESSKRAKRSEFEVSGHKFSGSFDEFQIWQRKEIEKAKKSLKNVNQDQFSMDKETEIRCINGKDSIIVSPIIDWSEEDVWSFLNGMEIEHCELYDRGYRRIGRILCPMASRGQKIKEARDYPHVKRNWIKTIKELYRLGYFGKEQGWGAVNEDEIAENIFDYWLSGVNYKQWYSEKFQQLKLFDNGQ